MQQNFASGLAFCLAMLKRPLYQPFPADFKDIFALRQIKGKRLVLQPFFVGVDARKQALVSLLFSVYIKLVHAQAKDIDPRLIRRLVQVIFFL
jgi:hypothetical protein